MSVKRRSTLKPLAKMTTIEEQVAQLDELTVDSRKEKLHELGCSVSGSKAVLKERLRKALMGDGKTPLGETRTPDDDESGAEDDLEDDEEAVDISSLTVKELRFRLKRLGLKTTGNKEELKNRLSAAWQDGDEDDENDAQAVHESEHGRAPLTQNGADDV